VLRSASLALWVWLLPIHVACALAPELSIHQLDHRRWGGEEFVPDSTAAFAQSADSVLWLASPAGLFAFNGLEFRGSNADGIATANLSALTADHDGALWLGYRLGGVGVVRPEGEHVRYEPDGVLPDGRVHGIAQERNGGIWVATDGGLAHFANARWSRISAAQGFEGERALAVFIDRDDVVWVASADAVFSLDSARRMFRKVASLPVRSERTKSLAQSPDGAIWLSDAAFGLIRLPTAGQPLRRMFADGGTGALLFDSDGNLWIAGQPLRRARARDLRAGNAELEASIEAFTRGDGLSGDVALSVFEDGEGGIWVGTNLGVDRFTADDITPVLPPPDVESWRDPGIVADNAGGVWVATKTGALLRYRQGRLTTRLAAPVFTAAARAADGAIWFGGRDGIGRLEGERLDLQPLPAAAAGRDVQTIAQDGRGDVWVSIEGAGLFRRRDGSWTPSGGLPALPRDMALSSLVDERGDVWFGYVRDQLAKVSGSQVTLYTRKDGLNVGGITALGARGSRIWIGGERGLAVLDGGVIHMTDRRSCGNFVSISGVLETRAGDLWLYRQQGLSVVRGVESFIRAGEWLRLECDQYARMSGIHAPIQLRPTPTLIESSDGRLWLASVDQVLWTDPQRLLNAPVRRTLGSRTPRAMIRYVSGMRHGPGAPDEPAETICRRVPQADCQLPQHTKDVVLTFATVTAREGLRFKFRVIGYDESWRYTFTTFSMFNNLDPGRYRAEVSASFDGNVWDEPDRFEFQILPAFYQTSWFRLMTAVGALVALVALFRLQVRRASARVRERFEARLSERERIARELHDTLLQGIQGLIMKIHAVALRIPEREPARATLDEALEEAEQVLVESRDRVTELRTAAADRDMTNDLALVGERLAAGTSIEFRALARGAARALHPIVREEAFLIAREMLVNAFRHARANRITAEVMFERAALRIVVTDDGRGLPADVAAAGSREGHWGLKGMRERTARIRATLHIGAAGKSGTRVELRVPAIVAYRSHRFISWLHRRPMRSSSVRSNSSEESD